MCAEILSWIWCGSDYLSFDCFSILTRVFRNPIFHKTFFDFNLCYIEISIEYMTLDLVWIFIHSCFEVGVGGSFFVGGGISLIFDCFSVLTRVFETIFPLAFDFFGLFFHYF